MYRLKKKIDSLKERKCIEMSIKKRLAALATAAVMAASLAGCADTSYVLQADGENINAGIYLDYMFGAMQQQIYMWQYSGVTENFFDQKVGEQTFEEYLLTTAMDQTKHYAAIEKLFKESGLKISSEDMKSINNSVSDTWESLSELYEKEGISKDSLKKTYVSSKKKEMLFDYYYGEGGKEAASKEDLEKYMNENYLRFKAITINKSTNEDETQKEAENKEKQELFEKYKEKTADVSFADFDALIDEYNQETAATDEDTADEEIANDTSEGEDGSSSTDEGSSDNSSEADDSSSANDSSSSDESTADDSTESEVTESVSSFEAENSEDESSVEEVTLDDPSSEAESDTADTADLTEETGDDTSDIEDVTHAEPTPCANDRLVTSGALYDDTLEGDYGKRMKAINDAAVNDIVTYEDDSAFYIISKGEVSERVSEYLDSEENFDAILHEAKDKDFEDKIKAATESISFSENKDAIDRYTPKTIYDRYNDYQKKNSTKNA